MPSLPPHPRDNANSPTRGNRRLKKHKSAGKIDIRQIAAVRSENPAQIYGLSHRKGFLLPGYDADLVIVDTECEEVLRNEDVVSKCGWTPLVGRSIKGDVLATIVRGHVVMEDRKLVGEPDWGRFVTRPEVESRLED